MVSLREDLKLLKCELICWNWSLDSAGVVCRLQKKARSMFKFTNNFSELFEEIENGNGSRRVSQIA